MMEVSDAQATAIGAAVMVGLAGRVPPWAGGLVVGLGLVVALLRGAIVWSDLWMGGLVRHGSGPWVAGAMVLLLVGRRRPWLSGGLGVGLGGLACLPAALDRRAVGRVALEWCAGQVAVVVGMVDALRGTGLPDGLGTGLALGLLGGPAAGPFLATAWAVQAGGSAATVAGALMAGLGLVAVRRVRAHPPDTPRATVSAGSSPCA